MSTYTRLAILDRLALLVLLIPIFTGCATTTPRETTSAGPSSREASSTGVAARNVSAGLTHLIRWQGESLSVIAQWYTGSSQNWPAIAEANPTLSPTRLMVGQAVFIPEGLLKRRDPMPESAVHPLTNEKTPAEDQSKPQAAPPVLFGPKI